MSDSIKMVKKYFSKLVAGTLATGMLFASVPNISNAEGWRLRVNKNDYKTKVTAVYSIPLPFFGEGKNTKYNSGDNSLESQVAGLSSVPNLKINSSEAYYEKYEGNWFTRPIKEFGHGATTPIHPYNTASTGESKIIPFYFKPSREGGILSPAWGVIATTINGASKLVGSEHKVYNPFEKNFWRTIGTTALEIGVGIAIGSGGGSSSSGSSDNTTEEDEEDTTPDGSWGDI